MAAELKQTEDEDELNTSSLNDSHFNSTSQNNNKKRKHIEINNDNPFAPVNKRRKIAWNSNHNNKDNSNNSNTNNSLSSSTNNNTNINNNIFSHTFKVKFSVEEQIQITTIDNIANGIRKKQIKIIPYPPKNPNNKQIIELYINSISDIQSLIIHNKNTINIKYEIKRICDNEFTLIFKQEQENKQKEIKRKQEFKIQLEKEQERQEKLRLKKEKKQLALLNNAWNKIFQKPKPKTPPKPKQFEQIKIDKMINKIPPITNTTGIYEINIKFNINTNIHTSMHNIPFENIFELSLHSSELNNICNNNRKLINKFENNNENDNKYTLSNVLDVCCRYNNEEQKINESKYKLNVKLFPYQIQSVEWIINEESNNIGLNRHYYIKYKYNNGNGYFYYSPILKHIMFNKSLPIKHGGFLCEEMGLGKTIEMLAIINYNKILNKNNNNNNNKLTLSYSENIKTRIYPTGEQDFEPYYKMIEYKYYKSNATLIIAPVSLVGQWEKECHDKSKIKLKMRRYYGTRKRDIKLYINCDIIFTTYGILGKENGTNRQKHILHNIEWNRIILDESHYIKNGSNVCSKNINNLHGINKWCLTGTPFGRKINDIINQFKFIGINNIPRMNNNGYHYNEYSMWNFVIKMIKPICMRHKKNQLFNNKTIVKMTEKAENIIYVNFTNEQQKKYYNKLFEIAKERYNFYKQMNNINRGIISILSSLLPARQACSGLIYSKLDIENELNTALKKSLSLKQMIGCKENINKTKNEWFNLAKEIGYNMDDKECPICFECPFDDPLQTNCKHVFCGECIKGVLIDKNECPMCRNICNINDLQRPLNNNNQNDNNNNNNNNNIELDLNGENSVKFDQKLKVLMQELNKLKVNKPNDKILIFTSFSKSLNWMCKELEINGFKYKTLTGSMSMNKRKKELEEFINNKNIKIFILTVRSGAVGITLNAANHIFMMEPCFNNSLYKQAINRVHRLGQKKKVFINTLIMKDSIEEKIWNINKNKELNNNNGNNSDLCGNISHDKSAKYQTHEISKLFE